ncbi:hypothetical protein [endosymbiont GvMRE of Glomus versiforme]|nr:hypothetical protein [endosymbiont GvMRE of Glomus versiforme]RHZ37749.1 hypothetical protein GvMRE_I1g532 [endosymbiont GvMRE of Glomus versiforme]
MKCDDCGNEVKVTENRGGELCRCCDNYFDENKMTNKGICKYCDK